MPHSYDYDAIVIGSGPGGEGAAMGLVKQGARVAVIERYQMLAAVAPTGAPSRRKLSVTPSAAL
ncbi:soluble pyridine nucleotide transhydrogenase [Escherichia coli]|uniref:Soluble pyridine nucleotide transhydrogenase n=1 Tax=Escherichia coli TaxID=562 RepID=A0A376TPI6_ECOLX|nr:soluble pyridine nucleotide transhydrogenase [Escherichia coli]